MIYSKKFNATHLVLGLDQLFDSEGNPVVGKYVSNKEELKTVEWIMRSFLKYGSYSTLLREIEKRKIVNKGEKPFTKGSLKTLLSNQKYIGKWEVNKKNQTKRQDKLMSYERYEKIDLPHGPVLDIDLWNQVQEKMIEVGHTNDKNDQHIHLLSAFLIFEEDESTFSGMHVRTKKKCYYSNKKHKFSLNAEVLENEARKILEEVISKTPKFQDALKITMKENEKKEDLMAYERIKIEKELEELNAERAKLDRRLDFLMDGVEDLETIKAFKIEYQTNVKVIAAKRAACSEALEEMTRNQKIFKKAALDIEGLLEKVKVALDYLEEHDRVALKNAYRAVFSKIVVGKKSDEGVRTLRFVLKSDGGFGKWTQKRIPVSPRGVGHVDKENVMKSGESLFTNSISENGVVNGNGSLDRVKMGWEKIFISNFSRSKS